MLNVDYKKSVINRYGCVSIFGNINGKYFVYNVHYGMGVTKDIKGNLTNEEMAQISNEFQESKVFRNFLKIA